MTKTVRRLIATPFRWAGLAWCCLIAALVVPAMLFYNVADWIDPPPVKTRELVR